MKKRKEFRVGDPVTDIINDKKGYVKEIIHSGLYPVTVQFEGYTESYTISGLIAYRNKVPRLIHGHNAEIEIIGEKLPEEPEVFWLNIYRNSAGNFESGFGYKSEEIAKKNTGGNERYIKTIKVEI